MNDGNLIDDTDWFIPHFSPVCDLCGNLLSCALRKCKAFDSIPMDIWLGENDHTKPYPGDSGITFAKWRK